MPNHLLFYLKDFIKGERSNFSYLKKKGEERVNMKQAYKTLKGTKSVILSELLYKDDNAQRHPS